MPPADDAAHNPLTADEVREALSRYAEAARAAGEVGNTLLQAKRHRQIDDLLDQLDILTLEAALLPPDPTSALLERIRMPGVA